MGNNISFRQREIVHDVNQKNISSSIWIKSTLCLKLLVAVYSE